MIFLIKLLLLQVVNVKEKMLLHYDSKLDISSMSGKVFFDCMNKHTFNNSW